MLDRTSAGALSAIAAALALVALSNIPQRAPAAPASKPPRSVAAATPSAVRALRDGTRLDLNRAQAADLELLPGIGPSLAQRIIDDRNAHGAFARIDALLRVRGVGPRTLDRLRGLLEVDAQQGRAAPSTP